jgi:hypothetical protein
LTRSFASCAIIGVKRLSTASVRFFAGVIPEIDIWRAATLMLKCYGGKALDRLVAVALQHQGTRSRFPDSNGASE